jgi:hypothetical protein
MNTIEYVNSESGSLFFNNPMCRETVVYCVLSIKVTLLLQSNSD